jgi:hypothetical protein
VAGQIEPVIAAVDKEKETFPSEANDCPENLTLEPVEVHELTPELFAGR